MKIILRSLLTLIAFLYLAGYSVAEAQVTYTIGGNLAGLSSGIVILKNGSDSLSLSANGSFTFPTPLASGSLYATSVLIQPPSQTCTVSGGDNGNGSGTVTSANVTSISVNCVSTYTVSGTISGLAASGLVLRLNATSLIVANGATTFKFATALTDGASYAVSVGIQPVGYTCTVTGGGNGNGTGTIASGNVTNIVVTCAKTYTIGGTISGLTGSGLRITLNGGSSKLIASNATSYVFSTALTSGTSYTVAIQTQPTGQFCTVTNGGPLNIGSTNVTNANISCISTYVVSGTVTGHTGTVTLTNNGSNAQTVLVGSSTFSFPAQNAGTSWNVVATIAGQTCSVTTGNAAGSNISANKTVTFICSATTRTIGGTVTGLGTGKTVILNNNGTDAKSITVNGAFTFATAVASGANYLVTVATQPAGQTCLVVNASGAVSGTIITNVAVICTTSTYTVGGTLSGLGTGQSVVLVNNGTNALTVAADGSFTFTTPLAPGAYAVTVQSQPVGQTCTVSAGSGTIISSNISNVVVTCTTNATNGNCSNASNASAPASDPFWAMYSAPTSAPANATPIIKTELADPFATCVGGP
jgi:hypothetical protein